MDWSALESQFNTGAAGFMTADALLNTNQLIAATICLIYMAWVMTVSYQNFGAGQLTGFGMLYAWARALFISTVVLFLISN